MGDSWPDNHWQQRLTVYTYILDGSHHRTLDTGASIVSWIILTDYDFDRAEHAQHDSRLVHVVDIL
jgi:hypothetical protein